MKKSEIKLLVDILGLVGIEATVTQLQKESDEDLQLAETWAAKSHFRASDNNVRVPPKPKFLNNYQETR